MVEEEKSRELNKNEWPVTTFCMGGFEDPMFFADDGRLFIFDQKEGVARRVFICNVNDILLASRAMILINVYCKAKYYVTGSQNYYGITFDSVNQGIITVRIEKYNRDVISLDINSEKFIEFLEATGIKDEDIIK